VTWKQVYSFTSGASARPFKITAPVPMIINSDLHQAGSLVTKADLLAGNKFVQVTNAAPNALRTNAIPYVRVA
jgi:hypothetical protein